MLKKVIPIFPALALAALLTACGTDSSSSGSGGSDAKDSGFSLRVTDAAIDDAVRVDITFTEIRLRQKAGGWITIPLAARGQKINVAALQGTKSESLVSNVTIEPGDYDELRLIVDTASMANSIELSGGGVHNLMIPSGGSSGLKIKGDFTVSDSMPTAMIVDVDLRQSIKMAGPNYIMHPVLRLVSGDNFGHVSGMVNPSFLTAPTCSDLQADTFNAIYVFAGHNATVDDIDQDGDPITTSRILYDPATSEYTYEAAFLPAGDYTIASTCSSDLDDPDTDEVLPFFDVKNVTVQVNNTLFL